MSNQSALPITGGCQCGAARYDANTQPIRPSRRDSLSQLSVPSRPHPVSLPSA